MTEVQQVNESADVIEEMDDGAEQYLTFVLGDEEYGVEILRVQEIKGWDKVTAIPNTPHYLCGVLNLRGTIVPVVNLRARFDMEEKEYTPTTVVIVLKVEGVTQRTVGIVVDGVSDAHNVSPEEIRPSPDFGTHVNTEYIRGLVPVDDKMMMILNVDRLLSVEAIG
ncbi:MAG: chemotaxis protein CheW [Gammaproteobacteria bacterium]|nr:chemotaxis protein CheW [Gammaproteobacteria bacterium]